MAGDMAQGMRLREHVGALEGAVGRLQLAGLQRVVAVRQVARERDRRRRALAVARMLAVGRRDRV